MTKSYPFVHKYTCNTLMILYWYIVYSLSDVLQNFRYYHIVFLSTMYNQIHILYFKYRYTVLSNTHTVFYAGNVVLFHNPRTILLCSRLFEWHIILEFWSECFWYLVSVADQWVISGKPGVETTCFSMSNFDKLLCQDLKASLTTKRNSESGQQFGSYMVKTTLVFRSNLRSCWQFTDNYIPYLQWAQLKEFFPQCLKVIASLKSNSS